MADIDELIKRSQVVIEASVYRACLLAALDELHTALQRIASLEAQMKAAREEIRRIVSAKIGDGDGLESRE